MSTPHRHRDIIHVAAWALFTASGCGLFEDIEPPNAAADAGSMDADEVGEDSSVDAGADALTDAAQDVSKGGDVCEANSYVRSGECTRCPTGTRRDAGDDPTGGDTACIPIQCGADQRVLSNQCIACVPGTRRDEGDVATGPDTVCTPIQCGADQRVEDRACVACVSGLSNLAGDDASGPDTTCDAASCPSNHRVLQNACVACALGTRRGAGDDASGPDTTCDAVTCVANERVVQNQCSPCAPGATNAAGDDASGADTTCDVTTCIEDERVVAHACESCPAGTTRAAGDLATGADTDCDPSICLEDERVVSNQCEPCAPGSTRPAGDVATGADTACQATLCVENAHVVSNQCTACPNGTVNEPGDDATGVDTACVADPCFTVYGILCDDITADYIKASNTDAKDGFGAAVAFKDDVLVVGAPEEASRAAMPNGDQLDNSTPFSGAVYVFERSGGTWSQTDYLKASNSGADDLFGSAVAVGRDVIVVGAPGEASIDLNDPGDDKAPSAGAVYVFERLQGRWAEVSYLKSASPGAGDRFGASVDIHDDTIVVGVPGEDSGETSIDGDTSDDSRDGAGAVYTYQHAAFGWALRSYIKAPNTGEGDHFGTSVSLHDGWLAVGAPGEASKAEGIGGDLSDDSASGAGAVYVYKQASSSWAFDTYAKPTVTDSGDQFGASVDVSSSRIAVGAPGESSQKPNDPMDNTSPSSGAVYVLEYTSSTWDHREMLKASVVGEGDRFGERVCIEDDLVLVGAPGEDSDARDVVGGDPSNDLSIDSGAAYLFDLVGGSWREVAYIKAKNSDPGDAFGSSLTLGIDRFMVGAPHESSGDRGVNGDPSDNSQTNSGAVYYGPAR